MADVGSSVPATQRKGDDRHNENKELLGSTLTAETGNRHRLVKTTRIKMQRKAITLLQNLYTLEERNKQPAPPPFTQYGL